MRKMMWFDGQETSSVASGGQEENGGGDGPEFDLLKDVSTTSELNSISYDAVCSSFLCAIY